MPSSANGYLTCTVDGTTGSVMHLMDFGSATGFDNIRTVTITRTIAGVVTAVRGADNVGAAGGFHAAIDHEVPFGTSVTYQAVARSASGSVLFTTSAVPVVVPYEPYTAWLKSLLVPRLSQRVNVQQYPDWTDDVETTVNYPYGRRSANVSQGVQQAGQGNLVLAVRDAVAREALRALLRVGGTYLLQPSAESTEPDVYVTRGKLDRTRPFQLSSQPKRLFTFPVVEVDRPSTTGSVVQLPGRTVAEAPALPASGFSGRAVDWAGH